MSGCIHLNKSREDKTAILHNKKYPQILVGTRATIFGYLSPWLQLFKQWIALSTG